MKTGTITIRLPIDKIERLKELAEKRGCSMAELLREPISTWLDLEAIGTGGNEEVLKQLEELKAFVSGNQQRMDTLIMGALAAIKSTRFYAAKACTFGDEMSVFIKDGTKLTEDQLNERAAEREQLALMQETILIQEIVESLQATQEEGGS